MKTTILTLLFAAFTGAVFGQAAAEPQNPARGDDPSRGKANPPEEGDASPIYQVGALVEYIQLDARAANKLVRKYAASLSAALLRDELEVMIDEGTADLVEACYVKTRSGQRTKVVSIDELIYPTEFDPPEIPQTVTLTDSIAPGTAANPTAFDVRNVGASLEIDPVISADNRQVELNIAPELVRYLGREYTVEDREGLSASDPRTLSSTIYQPKFYTMKVATAVTVRASDTVLLSMNRPHGDEDKMMIVLLRVDVVN